MVFSLFELQMANRFDNTAPLGCTFFALRGLGTWASRQLVKEGSLSFLGQTEPFVRLTHDLGLL